MFSPDLAYIFLQHLNYQQISDFLKKIVDVYAIARITSRETRRRKKKSLIFPGAISATSYIWNLAALQTILAHTMKILLCL